MVVKGVAGGDAINETSSAKLGEVGESGLAGIVFGGPDTGGGGVERKAVRLGQIGHKAGVIVGGLAAKSVVKVYHGEGDAVRGGQLAENVQETNGVRTAGDRHAHAISAAQHAITSENSLNFFEQAIL